MNVLDADSTPRVHGPARGAAGLSRSPPRGAACAAPSTAWRQDRSRGWRVLDGYLIAYLNIDEVIRIIRREDEPKAVADQALQAQRRPRPRPSSTCACAALRRLEEIEIRREHKALTEERKELKALLDDETAQLAVDRRRDPERARAVRRQDRSWASAAPRSPTRRPRSTCRSRPWSSGAGHGRLLGEGLDPRRQGPSRAEPPLPS